MPKGSDAPSVITRVHHAVFRSELGTDVKVTRYTSDPDYLWVSPDRHIGWRTDRKSNRHEIRANWETPKCIDALAPLWAMPQQPKTSPGEVAA